VRGRHRGAAEELPETRRWLHRTPGLDGLGVVLAGPQRQAELLADGVAGAEMVGMGVRHEVRGDIAAAEIAQDAPPRSRRARVDEHVADEVDVDRVGRPAPELVHVERQRSHGDDRRAG
jgi:hypothetical protein